MKTRIVYTKFWQDNYISSLSHKEKLLFIYLLTNEKVNLVGIYELPDKYILADLELTPKELHLIKQKFVNDNKFKFYQGYVKIVNCEKYNSFTGEKNELAKKKELALISDSVLKELDTVSIGYAYPMHSLNNQKSEIINQKSEIKKGREYEGNQKWLEKFNEVLKTNYRVLDEKSKKQIDNLIRLGFTIDDWTKAIGAASKDKFLMGENDRGKRYLSPEFISRLDKFQFWLEAKDEPAVKKRLTPIEILQGKTNYDITPIIKKF